MMYLIAGFLLATIGMTVLNCVGDLIQAITEWIKAHISIGIVRCNKTISELTPSDEVHTRAIGFATTFEEDEDNE